MMGTQMSSPGTRGLCHRPRVISFSSKHMASIADKYFEE